MKAVRLNIICCLVAFVACVQIIPEKAVVVSYNTKYIENSSIFITRHGRNSYLNIIGTNKHTWGNNVTVNLIVFDYVNNEYKRSFTEFHFRLCEMLNADPYIGAMVARTGITCPVYSMEHRMLNMTMPSGEYKYIVFFKKCMVQFEISLTSSRKIIGSSNIYFIINHKKN